MLHLCISSYAPLTTRVTQINQSGGKNPRFHQSNPVPFNRKWDKSGHLINTKNASYKWNYLWYLNLNTHALPIFFFTIFGGTLPFSSCHWLGVRVQLGQIPGPSWWKATFLPTTPPVTEQRKGESTETLSRPDYRKLPHHNLLAK